MEGSTKFVRKHVTRAEHHAQCHPCMQRSAGQVCDLPFFWMRQKILEYVHGLSRPKRFRGPDRYQSRRRLLSVQPDVALLAQPLWSPTISTKRTTCLLLLRAPALAHDSREGLLFAQSSLVVALNCVAHHGSSRRRTACRGAPGLRRQDQFWGFREETGSWKLCMLEAPLMASNEQHQKV